MPSLENQIFEWEEWEAPEYGETYFYRVTLVTPLGEFKVGRKFETAVLDSESSQLYLYDGDTRHTFDLTLTAYFTSSRKIS